MRKSSAGPIRALLVTLMVGPAFAQGVAPQVPSNPTPSRDSVIRIEVQADTQKGEPVTGLAQSDFSLLDNGEPRPISAFREVSRTAEPVEAILVLDAVNTTYSMVGYERNQLDKFFHNSGPKIPVPMTLALLTDKGLEMQQSFTQDTSTLSNLVENAVVQLREITRAAGVWGAEDRMNVSIGATQHLIESVEGMPGRKLILLVSPGWPLLSGPAIQLDARQQNQIFSSVVSLSAAMLHGQITVYSLNTLGPSESLLRENYYQSFLKGVRKPSETDLADLSIQVLALQSGGTVVNSSDLGFLLNKALQDANSWYQISFEPPPAEKPNEYHHLQVKVDRPGVVVRTRDGYYDQPSQVGR